MIRQYGNRNGLVERGNAAFYTLILIPFIVSLTVIAVDLSGWQALRQQTQAEADRLALDALRQLPDTQRARATIETAVANSEQHFEVATLDLDSRRVRLGLRTHLDAVFDIFMEPVAGAQVFDVYHESTAQVVPADYVLVVADGSTLRPQLVNNGGAITYEAPWGDQMDWPASGYFSCVLDPHITTPPEVWSWWQHWEEDDFRRWATQSCFNPVLSEVKRSAMAIVDSLSAFNNNRLGLLFTPGDRGDLGFAFARHIRGEVVTSTGVHYFPGQIGGFIEQQLTGAEAHWLNYTESESFLGDEACALFSQPLWDANYVMPQLSTGYGFPHTITGCSDIVETSPCGERHFPFNHLASCYLSDSLQLREAIYYHAAKSPKDAFTAAPDVIGATQQAIVELVNVPSQEILDSEATVRGNLAYQQLRKVIVLTDNLDSPTGTFATDARLPQLLQDLEATRTQLIVGVVYHPYLSATGRTSLAAAASALSAAGATLNDPSLVRVVVAATPEELRDRVTPLLIQLGREVALQK